MSIEDTIGYHADQPTCVVCGKGLKPGEALATLYHGGSKLPICCPLCLEAYEQDPKPCLERLAKQTLRDELRKLGRDAP
jgi:hypothetical protein